MSLDTNFNVNPYNDDFDDTKKYYRLLFKPGFAVQARELTQIQSVLQKQVGRFGNHIFKNGSLVSGGEFFIHKGKYVKIQDTYELTEVNVDEFENKTIYSNVLDEDDRPTKRAKVIKVYDKVPNEENPQPKTLLVAPIYGDDFATNEIIRTSVKDLYLTTSNTSLSIGTGTKTLTVETDLPYIVGQTIKAEVNASFYMIGTISSYNTANGQLSFNSSSLEGAGTYDTWTVNLQNPSGSFGTDVFANTVSSNAVGDCLLFSVAEGVFYYDGVFIRNDPQTIAISKYSYNDANASARIGFEIIESIVSSSEDSTLLDPAQDASNYQAPGSDRYKIELVLASRDLASTDNNKFIELMRVENGVIIAQNKFPIYSVLEDTFARRTYDESGNYTVRPFRISLETNTANTANANVTISPGKAYVFGYEFETIAPTTFIVDKPRTTANVINEYQTAEYGYFVYTNRHRGSFPIDSLNTVNVHCVPAESINTASAATISNTKIGTAVVKTIQFNQATDTTNANTYVYQTFLFDVQINRSLTGNVKTATSNTVTIGNTAAGQFFSTVTDAYKGAKIKIVSGPGSNELPKTITAFNGTTQTITVSDVFNTTPLSNSVFSIDFEIGDSHSFATHSGVNETSSANIDDLSKDFGTSYAYTVISERTKEPLIFKIGQDYVKEDSIQDLTYTFKRLYQNVQFTSNNASVPAYAGTELASSVEFDYYITVLDKKTSAYANNQVIPFNKINVDLNSATPISVIDGNDMIANIFAPVKVTGGNYSFAKTKQLVVGNTQTIATLTSPINVFGNSAVIVYPANGVTYINSSFVSKSPSVHQSLYVSDVRSIVKIIDLGTSTFTQENVSNNSTDITSNYILDNGQRDSFYDHASIRLKPRASVPTGNVVVFYEKYKSSNVGSFFSVDSYVYANSNVDYEEVPKYDSQISGVSYSLRDCLDFRPVKRDGAFTFDVLSGTVQPGPGIPEISSGIDLEYEYYLPRIDKVILDKDRTFKIVKGVPSLNPVEPRDSDTGMTLFVLNYSPYVGNTKDVGIRHIDHKRYTMRDIGRIEKRVENLEYYTALSLLEQQTLSQQDFSILDSQNLPRFKNGILVDNFSGFSASDVENEDFVAAIDGEKQELSPSFDDEVYNLKFNPSGSSNYNKAGSLVLKSATHVELIRQNAASLSVNVNPFNVLKYEGLITLHPDNDTWVDTETQPDLTVTDLNGDLAAWNLVANAAFSRTTSWVDNWFGVNPETAGGRVQGERITTTRTTTVTAERVVQNIGDRVVDVSIIPYMRTSFIRSVTTGMKSNTKVYPFFDNTLVDRYFITSSTIKLDNTIAPFVKTLRDRGETLFVTILDRSNNDIFGIIESLHVSENIIHFEGPSLAGFDLSLTSNSLYVAISPGNYEVPSERLSEVTIDGLGRLIANVVSFTVSSGWGGSITTNTLGLSTNYDVTGAENINSGKLVGEKITLVGNVRPDVTHVANITAYNSTTDTVTFEPALSQATRNIFSGGGCLYVLGTPKTDIHGTVCGTFYIPGGIFRTGDKSVRLIDNSLNDIGSASSWGDAKYFTQGILQTIEPTLVSAVQMRSATTSTTTTRPIYYDPLAQTFAVDPQVYPKGLFISKVRLSFKSKDDIRPVRLEIRPTVNGYPSSSEIYPYSSVELSPSSVNVSDTPSLTNSKKYTEFVFESPVYLLPGEHAIVLISDSNNYEVYAAEMGGVDLNTGDVISDQPYGGSLFKSQNARTWTAEQNIDMMFSLFRYNFDTSVDTTVQFIIADPIGPRTNIANTIPAVSEDHLYDILCLGLTDIQPPGTTIKYEFNSLNTSNNYVGYKVITPKSNYELNDGGGRRLISSTIGNTSILVRATLSSSSPEVSPLIKTDSVSVHAIKHVMNNLGLSNNDVFVENGGSGYTLANTYLTITGGNGTGANASPVIENSNVVGIIINDEGSGYTESPTITVVSSDGTGAAITYNGENTTSGGNADVRYLTKTVTLADGFDSGDLRVYLTAYKPAGSNIDVYYKIISDSDPDTLSDKSWKLMTQLGPGNIFSANRKQYREIVYAPGTNGIPDNFVSYDTYRTFKTFQIKVVLSGVDTTNPPKIADLRVIALPGETTV